MLETLISFNTVSDRSNLGLIAFVEDYLAGLGVTSVRVPDATGEKAGLHALVGPAVDGGVVLSAHTDVVPVDGQAWTQDPFNAWEEGGPALRARSGRHERLCGNGACQGSGLSGRGPEEACPHCSFL
ncbi:hypothetical protein QW131_24395 [Roseibium salinum]|nr:hypothetical protein [Roseibium salinum]